MVLPSLQSFVFISSFIKISDSKKFYVISLLHFTHFYFSLIYCSRENHLVSQINFYSLLLSFYYLLLIKEKKENLLKWCNDACNRKM
jgi:hypothetical protein